PLAIAAPAAVASLAYLNARTQFSHDYGFLYGHFRNAVNVSSLEKRDRLNLFYVLEDHARSRKTANHPFIVYRNKSRTYSEVYEIVLKYATWLKTRYAVAPKEIVAMDFMNSDLFVFILLAILSLGAVPALINYNLSGKPLIHCINTSTSRIVLVDEELTPQFTTEVTKALASPGIRNGKGPVEVVYFHAALKSQILETRGVREPDTSRSNVRPRDMSLLIFTSGTTGHPKPAIISWSKFLSGSSFYESWMGWKRKTERFYTCMPLYHSTATILGLCPVLCLGSTIIIGRKFSHRTFWPEVRESKATIIQYVGETCRYLLAAPPLLDPITGKNLDKDHHVRLAYGNGLRPDIWDRFKTRFGIETIAEMYSASEATSASLNLSSNGFASGAVGRAGTVLTALLKKKQVLVEVDWEAETPFRDPERHNFCKPVERGQPGEVLWKLDPADIKALFQGYFGNETATNSKIMRDVLVEGDAYYRTGDVMRWDKEGRMWFVDRIGDTFRWKSENVSTFEVAEAVGRHSAVIEANVYGVGLPNHDGRAGCVAIIFDRDVDANLLSSVAEHVGQTLPKYAVPIFLRVTKNMQATGTNKQQKHILRSQGVDLEKMTSGDKLYWLKGGSYVEFQREDWENLQAGNVKL
ncbi:MAG: hypothetical protein Q9187_005676, partial [Circinaria calcarea]